MSEAQALRLALERLHGVCAAMDLENQAQRPTEAAPKPAGRLVASEFVVDLAAQDDLVSLLTAGVKVEDARDVE